jgi:hypothetical protein
MLGLRTIWFQFVVLYALIFMFLDNRRIHTKVNIRQFTHSLRYSPCKIKNFFVKRFRNWGETKTYSPPILANSYVDSGKCVPEAIKAAIIEVQGALTWILRCNHGHQSLKAEDQ